MIDSERIIVDNLGWLKKKAYRYCPNKEMAEDLVGDTVYKLLRSKDRFNDTKDFKPWALAILQNTYITQYNRRKSLQISDLSSASESLAPERAHSLAEYHEIIDALRRCSRKSICIRCVILYARGYSYDEIADIVGITIGTVKSRISAGRKLIKNELEF